ncbi:MAG: dUTP diphosphatase [Spirochaetae bacterium HGW-Spirochaetae-10]|nr:MAG: dUTP diphosphatase [Spirochaetae bacterium HGW-Spirochaetae-10]
MSEVRVKIHAMRGAQLPDKASEGAAGYDVRALLPPDTEIVLEPGDRFAVPTGLYFAIPRGYFITVRPRSGLAIRDGVTLVNSPGTIDSDYRGELKVLMINLGQKAVTIRSQDRIAQLLLERETPFQWEETPLEDLDPTQRGAGGFGSTGLA